MASGKKPPKEPTTPSEAKSEYAIARPRVGGRFVSTKDPEAGLLDAEIKLAKKMPVIKKEDVIVDNRAISDKDKEYIGTDSRKFFEVALANSRTWYEGAKYAKELKPLQHPSLQSTQVKADIVTEIVVKWDWDGTPEGALIEHNESVEDIHTLPANETAADDTHEPQEV